MMRRSGALSVVLSDTYRAAAWRPVGRMLDVHEKTNRYQPALPVSGQAGMPNPKVSRNLSRLETTIKSGSPR